MLNIVTVSVLESKIILLNQVQTVKHLLVQIIGQRFFLKNSRILIKRLTNVAEQSTTSCENCTVKKVVSAMKINFHTIYFFIKLRYVWEEKKSRQLSRLDQDVNVPDYRTS